MELSLASSFPHFSNLQTLNLCFSQLPLLPFPRIFPWNALTRTVNFLFLLLCMWFCSGYLSTFIVKSYSLPIFLSYMLKPCPFEILHDTFSLGLKTEPPLEQEEEEGKLMMLSGGTQPTFKGFPGACKCYTEALFMIVSEIRHHVITLENSPPPKWGLGQFEGSVKNNELLGKNQGSSRGSQDTKSNGSLI